MSEWSMRSDSIQTAARSRRQSTRMRFMDFDKQSPVTQADFSNNDAIKQKSRNIYIYISTITRLRSSMQTSAINDAIKQKS